MIWYQKRNRIMFQFKSTAYEIQQVGKTATKNWNTENDWDKKFGFPSKAF